MIGTLLSFIVLHAFLAASPASAILVSLEWTGTDENVIPVSPGEHQIDVMVTTESVGLSSISTGS